MNLRNIRPPGFWGNRFTRRQWLRGSAALLPLACGEFAAGAPANEPPTIDPRAFGLDVPSGKLLPGNQQAVTLADGEGRPVVGRVHVRVGEHSLVLLPNGQLAARRGTEVTPTDRPFVPLTRDEMAKRLAQGALAGFQVKQSANYVYVFNTSELFSFGTQRILESMLPGVQTFAKGHGLAVRAPEFPLVAIMFRTEEEFQRFRRMPPGVVAYYDTLSNQVVMYEEAKIARVKPELAVQQAISTVAHEGTHQILHNIGVQQRLSLWPMWLAEGLAEYLAPTSVGKDLKWKGAGQVNDFRMLELEQYLKAKKAEAPDGQLIEHTVLAGQLTSTGYATSWALTHFLAKNRREPFEKYLREISRLGPLQGQLAAAGASVVPGNFTQFTQFFGRETAALERLLVAHLKRQPYNDPFAEFPHFVVTIFYPALKKGNRDANVFHTPELAVRWQRETLERAPAEARATAESKMFQAANRAAAEALAREFLAAR